MGKTSTTRRISYLGRDGIGGGLVSENPIALSENQMVIADNILVGTAITRRKRGGREKWHTGTLDQTASYPSSGASGLPIRGIIDFWRTASMAGNTTRDLFLHQGTQVWSIQERNTPGFDRTNGFSFDTTGVPCYQPFNSRLYFTSTKTTDGYNKWPGAGNVAAANAPPDGPGKYITIHLGRMIMAGNPDYPFRVYFSSALDPEDWSTVLPSNATSIDLPDDGDPNGISGLASFQGRLYVGTRRSWYEVTGTDPSNLVVQKISDGIGVIGHASICQTPNDIIFASDRGVHSLRQLSSGRQSESNFLSKDIQKLWTELLNAALFERIMSAYDETINCVIYSVPSSGQIKNDNLLVYNIEFNIWTVWPNIEARAITTALIGNKKNLLIGQENGVIGLLNQPARTDYGGGYTARFRTGVLYPGGDPTTHRVFKSVTILASTRTPSNFAVSWTIDGKKTGSKAVSLSAGEDLLGSTFVLGQSRLGVGQYTPITISMDEVGYGVQLEVTATGTSDIEFYGFFLEVDFYAPITA